MINRQAILVVVLCILTLLAAMNSVIFNVALPVISEDLSIDTSKMSWISVGYTSIIAVGSLVYGQLFLKYSLRLLFIIGILLFCIGSIVGFFGYDSYGYVLTGRLIQASGSSAFVTLSMLTINKHIPKHMRGSVLSFLSISIALALGVGPMIGGVLISLVSWKYLFLIMITSSILPIFIWCLLSESESITNFKFDYYGLFLSLVFIISMMLGINQSPYIFFVTLICIVLIIKWEKKSLNPFINLEVFSNKLYKSYLFMGFILNACHLGILFLIPLLLADKYHLSSEKVGIIFFIGCLFGIVANIVAKKMIEYKREFEIMLISTIIILLGTIGLWLFWEESILHVIIAFIFICIGYSPIQVVLNSLIPRTLSTQNNGPGLGLYNMFNFIGMAFGPALVSKMLVISYDYNRAVIVCIMLTVCNLMILPLIKNKL